MDFTTLQREDGITVLKLEGRMDLDGADVVGNPLAPAPASPSCHAGSK